MVVFSVSQDDRGKGKKGKNLSKYLDLARELGKVDEHKNNNTTKRLMTMHKSVHPRYDIDKLYIAGKEERRITGDKDCMNGI